MGRDRIAFYGKCYSIRIFLCKSPFKEKNIICKQLGILVVSALIVWRVENEDEIFFCYIGRFFDQIDTGITQIMAEFGGPFFLLG